MRLAGALPGEDNDEMISSGGCYVGVGSITAIGHPRETLDGFTPSITLNLNNTGSHNRTTPTGRTQSGEAGEDLLTGPPCVRGWPTMSQLY